MPSPICPAPRTPTVRISMRAWPTILPPRASNCVGWPGTPRRSDATCLRMSDETTTIVSAVRAALDEALAAGRRSTEQGKAIDDHQVHAERLAYAATEAAAAEAFAAYATARRDAGAADPIVEIGRAACR